MQEFDVIICGAGPAGTTCALGLFNAGLKVALIDKRTFPREKVCGDAYEGNAHKILNTISPDFGRRLKNFDEGIRANRIKVTSPKNRRIEFRLSSFFSILPRALFDNFLLTLVKEETDTQLVENTTVQSVVIEQDYVQVKTNNGEVFKAKVVVGCDGAHSVVQSALTNTRESLTEVCPSLRGYYKGVKGLSSDTLEIHFLSKIPKGYFWIFPTTDGLANVGIGATQEILAKYKINLRKSFYEILAQEPAYKARFADAELIGDVKGWSVPIGYFDGKLPITGNRVILCGDAASLVDPATGEGIAPAMSSGRYAAVQIKKCFSENNFCPVFMKGYDAQIRSKYFRSYWIRSFFTDVFNKFPNLFEWLILLLGHWHRLRDTNK